MLAFLGMCVHVILCVCMYVRMYACMHACFTLAVGEFVHSCEGDLVCKSSSEKVPYFNAPIYLENKSQVGKVDEIFGQISSHVSSDVCSKGWGFIFRGMARGVTSLAMCPPCSK